MHRAHIGRVLSLALLAAVVACGKRDDAPAPIEPEAPRSEPPRSEPPRSEPPRSDAAASIDASAPIDAVAPIDAAAADLPPAVRALLAATDDAHADAFPDALLAWHQSGTEVAVACGEDARFTTLAPLLHREEAYLAKLEPARVDDPHVLALLHLGESLRRSTASLPMGVGFAVTLYVARWAHDHHLKLPQTYPVPDDFAVAAARIDIACLHDSVAKATAADLGMTDEDEVKKQRRELGLPDDVTFESEVTMLQAFLRETQTQLANVHTAAEMQRILDEREKIAVAHPRSVMIRVLGRSAGMAGSRIESGVAEYRELTK